MTDSKTANVRRFLQRIALPESGTPEGIAPPAPTFDFDVARNQAAIVGSDVLSFVEGVTSEQRADIARSSLLAQLVAKQRVPDASRIYDWYEHYFDTLLNIGWLVQERSFAEYAEASRGFEAHEAILKVASSLLGPGTAALAVVTATLDALGSLKADSPWITLFEEESRSANTAHFQVSLVEPAGKDFMVSLMAFGLTAKSELTQVLFFKFAANEVTLKRYAGKVTVDAEVLAAVRPDVTRLVTGYARAFVRGLPPLRLRA
jgi:hypothetical protein